MANIKRILIVVIVFLTPNFSLAEGWSVNIGNKNPPEAQYGLNFMYLWTNWAVELGAGYVRSEKDDNDRTVAIASGDLNLKYLFGSGGGFRPYMQIGTGLSFGASGGGSASTNVGGSNFAGLGFFGMGSTFYGYASVNGTSNTTSVRSTFLQFGLGYNF